MEMGIHPKISIGRQLWMGQRLVGVGGRGYLMKQTGVGSGNPQVSSRSLREGLG